MKKSLDIALKQLATKHGKNFTLEFLELVGAYTDNEDVHQWIYEKFYRKTNDIEWMKAHRDFIEKYGFGYGDRPFHYEWKLLIEQLGNSFSILEIGVFKGQTLSLAQLIADKLYKEVKIVGVTPLSGDGDHYFSHPDVDYMKAIKTLYKRFHLTFDNTEIIKGFSQEKKVVTKAVKKGPFDIVYIDGSHDYEIVVQDIENYSPSVKVGGFLVIDDAAHDLAMPKHAYTPELNPWKRLRHRNRINMFVGFEDVANAIHDTIEKDKKFVHIFAVGHNRVWLRIS